MWWWGAVQQRTPEGDIADGHELTLASCEERTPDRIADRAIDYCTLRTNV